MYQHNTKVVIDLGSGTISTGYGMDDEPTSDINKSLTGQSRRIYSKIKSNSLLPDLKYPIDKGIITQLDDLELMLEHLILEEMKIIEMKEYPILIGYNSLNNVKRTRVGITEIVFEKLGVPVFALADRNMLSLLASGRTTGLVLKSGDCITNSVTIDEGQVLTQHCCGVEFGGRDLSLFLEKLIENCGYKIGEEFDSSTGVEHLIQIKQRLCQISMDYHWETQRFDICDRYYEIGENGISLGLDQYKSSIHELILKSLQHLDSKFKEECQKNIILSGGNTLFPNFTERLKRELNLTPCRVVAPPERKYSSWIGGSILSSIQGVDSMWILR
ncbi:hypothetical protein NAEGRDRAFT_60995 [Naegleria gruberi]|uniref:Actin n=1 Tax=Naegleria gruberi TaxID=5762 RepID=D2W1A8_NAEGR|nr:uncharacterized protein NAEGRDRAFT_60995 [Naegleria gruberi]EFC37194.1 hypothetical protein NAEGRDRAFT_60995 [Naegleria gruberi]|eukprot:XP_002669938.1 hypothetical protein NAEGRDRAFT_60995 [Naegleria gruberi strain NEG-M]